MNREFWRGKRVVVTGGAGFLGKYVVENLAAVRGVDPADIVVPRSKTSDLTDWENARAVMDGAHVVIHLAAVTGGIAFSRAHPASQYDTSTRMDLNVVRAAHQAGVRKLIAIGNLFAYAPDAPVPLSEVDLYDGLPTDSHRGVGWLKRNLALMADLYFREYGFQMGVVYSANAYGPGDSLDLAHSHVIPATIMKCFRDDELVVWGDGTPTRDFLFAEDIAEGLLLAAERLDAPGVVNLGSGREVSIRQLVTLIAEYARFKGKVTFDTTKSGGDARRCASTEQAARLLGFHQRVPIEDGLRRTVEWYAQQLVRR